MNYTLKDIIDKGILQGYLTSEEIIKCLPETTTDKKTIDDIFIMIEKMNIKIIRNK